jgi:hypothetical protein
VSKKKVTIVLLRLVLFFVGSAAAYTQEPSGLRVKARIDETAIAEAVSSPRLVSYDLSPDGSKLALFVASGDLVQAPNWVLILNIKDVTVISKIRFGEARLGYAPQIEFTPDGRFLLVQDGQTIAVLDAKRLTKVRTIAPPRDAKFSVPATILMASKRDIAAVSFGKTEPPANYFDKWPVDTQIVDIERGDILAAWESDDIPFSISPSGRYVVLSNRESKSPIMGVAILDSMTGKEVATLSGGDFPVKQTAQESFAGRMIAKFINEDSVVLTQDGNLNQIEGNVRIVQYKTDRTVQEIRLPRYGPTGEIAVSGDENVLIALSIYLPREYRKHPHWRIPKGSGPELVAFDLQPELKLAQVRAVSEVAGLRGPHRLFDWAGLRVSNDGLCISVAENHGVTVFEKRKPVGGR